MAILLLYFVETTIGGVLLIHSLGLTLLAGRLLHAYGISQPDESYGFRVAGMALTFTVLISSTLTLAGAYVGILDSTS